MRFVCLGTGDAFSATRYSSSLAVESDGTWLLVDCPHPIRKILRDSSASAGCSLDVTEISGVILTHLHADHVSGLEDFVYYNLMIAQRRPTLLMHPEVAEELWAYHFRPTLARPRIASDGTKVEPDPSEFWDLIALDEEAPAVFGPYSVECRRTDHPIPTFALRLTAEGRTLSVSADTGFDPALIAWLERDADLIVHETNHGIHTPYERLAELPDEIRSRMRLIHFPDDFPPEHQAIERLVDGGVYEVRA